MSIKIRAKFNDSSSILSFERYFDEFDRENL